MIKWRANPLKLMEIVSAGSVLAAVMGITQAIKMLGLPSRFAPISSIAVGIAFAMFFLKSSSPETVFAGVVMGLTVSGLWSGSKALLGK